MVDMKQKLVIPVRKSESDDIKTIFTIVF
jgi:hypothetical protein